jgi:ribosomal protein S18 acetylase RimI-like enzyme
MPDGLAKHVFTEDDWEEVQSFDCGDEPFAREVTDWLRGPFGSDSALTAIRHPDRPCRVWLYRLEDGALVGFGALGKSEWRWKGKKDPKVPLTVIVWVGIGKEFRGQPPGLREGRYSAQILDDLIAEALEDQETHPVLGLFVQTANVRAIELYRRAGFTEELEPFVDKQTGVEYRRMAMVLNPEALLRLRAAAGK